MPEQSAYMRAAVDISHLGARVEDEGVLLEAVADLLRRSLELVATQVYLVDPTGLFGELRHHVGAGDRKTILRTPGVPVGAGSELGEVLAAREARVMQDMRSLPRSAVPPGAQKGMALPLIVEGRALGALVLYVGETGVLSKAAPDIAPLTMLADMLALALEAVQGRALARRETSRPRARGATAGHFQAMPRLEKPARYSLAGEGESRSGTRHSTPITMRGSVVGSMAFREREDRALGPEEVELIESVADQVGQAIENLSLLEEAQRVALREQLISDITAQLQRATSVDEVLKTAARAVRTALGDIEVTARLAPQAVTSVAQAEPTAEESEAK